MGRSRRPHGGPTWASARPLSGRHTTSADITRRIPRSRPSRQVNQAFSGQPGDNPGGVLCDGRGILPERARFAGVPCAGGSIAHTRISSVPQQRRTGYQGGQSALSSGATPEPLTIRSHPESRCLRRATAGAGPRHRAPPGRPSISAPTARRRAGRRAARKGGRGAVTRRSRAAGVGDESPSSTCGRGSARPARRLFREVPRERALLAGLQSDPPAGDSSTPSPVRARVVGCLRRRTHRARPAFRARAGDQRCGRAGRGCPAAVDELRRSTPR